MCCLSFMQVAKILHVEESLASNCTCMLCLEVLQTPTTCVPCGHTYCKVRNRHRASTRLVNRCASRGHCLEYLAMLVMSFQHKESCRQQIEALLNFCLYLSNTADLPHTLQGCLDRHNGLCAECGDSKPDRTVFNGPLESICSKYEYKLSALTALQRALQQAAGEASGGGGKAK
jgi:hypothetical protein